MVYHATQNLSIDGSAVAFNGVALENKFTTGNNIFLIVGNGDGAIDLVASIVCPKTLGGLAIEERVFTIPPFSYRYIKVPSYIYKGGDGLGSITFDRNDATIYLAVMKV